MINIYEYIIGKNTKVVKNLYFKQFETKEEVCDFFDSKGFEKFESDDFDTYEDMIINFSDSKKPIYCTGEFEYDSEWWVRFGKCGEDEYIFYWNVKGTMSHNNYLLCDSNDRTIKEFKTFKEFREYVINYFNW